MKTGITGFIASQDAVIVIDANRKKVFTIALGVKTTHRKGEGSLPQRASPENSPGKLRAMSDVTEIPPPLVA